MIKILKQYVNDKLNDTHELEKWISCGSFTLKKHL
jgi:hypothetical protein